MPNWTRDQASAIEARNCNLLVSAAAGSGKTAVLVERIIKLVVEDKINIDTMLIVTFTNAAAGEMRERILNAFMELIEDGHPEEEFLREQINKISKAYIMTLHSFCKDIVKKNFFKVDIDPSFTIGDTTDLAIKQQEILDEIFEEEYEKKDKQFIDLVESYSSNKTDAGLVDKIYKVHNFSKSQPDPIGWLYKIADDLNIEKEEFDDTAWTKALIKFVKIELEGLEAIINEAYIYCEYPDGPTEYIEAISEDIIIIEKIRGAADGGYEELYKVFENVEFQRLKSIKKDRKEEISPEVLDKTKDRRNHFKKEIKSMQNDYFSKSIDQIIEELRRLAPLMKYMVKIVEEFENRYFESKKDEGVIDFNDLEHLALEILDDESISSEYKKKFNYIFLDEYQDSNIVQETLISKVKRDDNVFLVGDVKQSIYKFRLADPSLFMHKFKTFSKEVGETNRRIDLSQNFRTRGEILEGINDFFSEIMSEKLGEIPYTDEVYLYKGLANYPDGERKPEIEVNIIDMASDDDESFDELDEELQRMKGIEVEAEAMVKSIKSLIGTKKYSPKKGEFEDIQFKDIVILLRTTRNVSNVIGDVLAANGVPVSVDAGVGFFDSIEIKMILSLLRIIDNKLFDVDMITVMRSPLCDFDIDELVEIRKMSHKKTYFECMKNYMESFENGLSEKITKFVKQLEIWDKKSRYSKLDDFIWNLMIETGYYTYCGAMPEGELRQANLRLLVDRASQLENSNANSLFNFVKFIEKIKKSTGDMEAAKLVSEADNVVRIMSIHKSKGLEFPVVYVANSGKKFNKRDTYEDVMLHKDLGLASKLVDWEKRAFCFTFPQLAMKKQITNELLSEEMRILYVALTRAVDRLIVFGSSRDYTKAIDGWSRGTKLFNLIKCNSYIDWICSFVFDEETNSSNWGINVIKKTELLGDMNRVINRKREIQSEILSGDISCLEEELKVIQDRFSFEYTHKEGKLPTKLSVSELNKVEKENIDINEIRLKGRKVPLFAEDETISATDRGNIIHKFMEIVDVNKTENLEVIQAQIDGFINNKIFSSEEAKHINPLKMHNFFNSKQGEKIRSSKSLKREMEFVYKKEIGEDWTLVQGIIDMFYEDDGELVIVDYKTDNTMGGSKVSQILKNYRVQILTYKEALESVTGKKVKASYLYLFDEDDFFIIE